MKRYRMKSDLKILIYFVFLCAFQFFYGWISIRNRMQNLVTIIKLSIILSATSCEINQIEITRYRKETMKSILISFLNYFCLQFIFSCLWYLIWSRIRHPTTNFTSLLTISTIRCKLINLKTNKTYNYDLQDFRGIGSYSIFINHAPRERKT